MNEQERLPISQTVESPPWIEERTILLTYAGSKAYGTFIEGESDIDYKGVCIPPEEYFLGLNSFNEFNTVGGKNFKNKAGDIDVTIIHINKFVKEAMLGIPNNIEILFVREEDIIKANRFGRELISHRHDFLSKHYIKQKYGNYAESQIKKMKKGIGACRQDLVEKYGYDTKFFSHAVRLLTSAIEILKTGDFSTYRPNAKELIRCRNGAYSFDEAIRILDELEEELEAAYRVSKLPDVPDTEKINRWLIELNKKALFEAWD